MYLPLFCCPLFPENESMLEEIDAVIVDDDVVVGDFCSILIKCGVPAKLKLFDVVISDTWHGSRLICRSVAVVCVASADGQLPKLALEVLCNCWSAWFHVSGNVRLQPVPFGSTFVSPLLWCCWCRLRMQSLIFLFALAAFNDFFVVLDGVFEEFDDDDDVDPPEWIFSVLMAAVA